MACVAAGVSLGWLIASKFYEERIAVLTLRISDYQERLGLVAKDLTTYSKMTHKELRQATLLLVQQLREFQQQIEHNNPTNKLISEQRASNLSENERQQRFQTVTSEILSFSQSSNLEFQRDYQARAKVLGDELRKRLPKQKMMVPTALEHGTLAGVRPVGEVATYLESLAKLLP